MSLFFSSDYERDQDGKTQRPPFRRVVIVVIYCIFKLYLVVMQILQVVLNNRVMLFGVL